MLEFKTSVSDIIQRTHNIKSFRFTAPENINFKAGQFFFLTIKIDGQEQTKHFSFSNSPTEEGYIEFTKKLTPSDFSKALGQLKKGDWAKIKMPYGSFTFQGEYEKIAFLCGGIGITPARGICKYAADKALPTDIVLFYSNMTEADIAFRQDFDSISSENKNIRVVYTLTSPDIDKNKWRGETGYITDQMIKKHARDYAERVFYSCGPPQMVTAMVDILRNKLNIAEDMIKTENFTGY